MKGVKSHLDPFSSCIKGRDTPGLLDVLTIHVYGTKRSEDEQGRYTKSGFSNTHLHQCVRRSLEGDCVEVLRVCHPFFDDLRCDLVRHRKEPTVKSW